MPWREIGEFVVKLVARVGPRHARCSSRVACRSGEVRGATWSEFYLGAKLCTIPGERMKAWKEPRVASSTGAIAPLDALPREGDFVFPGWDRHIALSDMSLIAVLRRMERGDITVHGFRSHVS